MPQPERKDTSWDGPFVIAALFFAGVGKTPEGNDIFLEPFAGSVGNGAPDSYREAFFMVRLVGGRKRGNVVLETFCRFPDGSRERVTGPDRLLFDGPGARHNATPLIRIPAHTEGTLWFEVVVDGVIKTRTPFEIQHELPVGP